MNSSNVLVIWGSYSAALALTFWVLYKLGKRLSNTHRILAIFVSALGFFVTYQIVGFVTLLIVSTTLSENVNEATALQLFFDFYKLVPAAVLIGVLGSLSIGWLMGRKPKQVDSNTQIPVASPDPIPWRVWKIARWPFVGLAIIFILFIIFELPKAQDRQKTAEAVAKIHATRLTHNDVFGPVVAEPDRVESDKTLVGIDANKNGIRDDVELDIYHAHQDSAKVTAAMLQYAKELQLEFTSINSSETWVAVQQVQSRGIGCVIETAFAMGGTFDIQNNRSDEWLNEVEERMFSTDARKQKREEINRKYKSAFVGGGEQDCDLDPSQMEN